MGGRRGDDGPRLDRDGGARRPPRGGSSTADAQGAARDGDPDRGVAIGAVEAVRPEQRRRPARERPLSRSAGSWISRPAAERRSRAMCSVNSVGRPPRARSVSKIPSPSWNPRSNTDRCRLGRQHRRRPRRDRAASCRSRTSTPPIALERPARLGHGLVPLRGRVAAPRDAAADVERQPAAVGDERADEDAGLHRAVRPDPAERRRCTGRGGPARAPR